MILIDTSSWIEQMRRDGRQEIRKRVDLLLSTGEAAWCSVVRLELWNGARGQHEIKVLTEMELSLPELEITNKVWQASYALARSARVAGITVPPQDLLVAACAKHYRVQLEHADAHFDALMTL